MTTATQPEIKEINVSFGRNRGGFRHADASTLPSEFHRSRPNSPLMTFAPGNRLKAWGTNLDGVPYNINGEIVYFDEQSGELFTAYLTSAQVRTIISNQPGSDDEPDPPSSRNFAPDPDGFLDVCIETTFDEDSRASYYRWTGNVANFPEWMGDVNSISVTPPQTGGGWHDVRLDAPDADLVNKGVVSLRLNGVWMYVMPIADVTDENNHIRFGGRYSLICDPEDLEEVRSYGQGLASVVELDDEPMAPRSRAMVRKVHHAVAGGISDSVYWEWLAAIKKLVDSVCGMAATQGQVDYYSSSAQRNLNRSNHYLRLVTKYYNKRADAYKDYTVKAWVDEAGDRNVKSWWNSHRSLNSASEDSQRNADRLSQIVSDRRQIHDEALAKCEEFEALYSDGIKYLLPA